jgi:hypothetical protein
MKELDTKEAGSFAFAAVMDAQRRNSNNKSHYSAEQIRKAVTASDLIDTAFSYSKLYINYRQKFIAIKAESARAKSALGKEVIDFFETSGYGVVSTPQGLIVRIDKK